MYSLFRVSFVISFFVYVVLFPFVLLFRSLLIDFDISSFRHSFRQLCISQFVSLLVSRVCSFFMDVFLTLFVQFVLFIYVCLSVFMYSVFLSIVMYFVRSLFVSFLLYFFICWVFSLCMVAKLFRYVFISFVRYFFLCLVSSFVLDVCGQLCLSFVRHSFLSLGVRGFCRSGVIYFVRQLFRSLFRRYFFMVSFSPSSFLYGRLLLFIESFLYLCISFVMQFSLYCVISSVCFCRYLVISPRRDVFHF